MTLLRRDIHKDIATLTKESIATYREGILKDINLKVRINLNNTTYITEVSEWKDDTLILVAPLDQLDWVILPRNTNLEIALMTKAALFTTIVQIMTPLKKEGTVYYPCQVIRPLVRRQQRQSFRLDITIDTSFQLLPEGAETIPLNIPHYKGTILNISLGGLCFVSDVKLSQGTLVYMTFEFLDTALSLMGEILFEGERTSTGTYSHRVKFVGLSNTDETTLGRLIMAKQRLLRKNL